MVTKMCPDELSNFDTWCRTDLQKISYTYKWTISNFSQRSSHRHMVSSTFKFGAVGKERSWHLELIEQSVAESTFVGYLQLHMINRKDEAVHVDLNIYAVDANVQPIFKTKSEAKNKAFYFSGRVFEIPFVIEKEDILPGNDELHIFCHISVIEQILTVGENDVVSEGNCVKDDIAGLLKSREFSDVTLVAEEKEFPAHKAILAARSPVFAAMFTYNMKENRENKVVIKNMTYESLSEMMSFVYTGTVEKLYELTPDLLDAAEKYQMDGLKLLCSNALSHNVTVESAAGILLLSDVYNLHNLKKQVVGFIKRHIEQVKMTETWKLLVETRQDLIILCFVLSDFDS